jgi:tetratricopeptide (TPR) repeat protein
VSQRQLAFQGCSPAYISRIEAGDRIPSLQLLRELGRRLGVSEDYLATGSERSVFTTALLDAEVALRLDDIEEARRLYEQGLADALHDRGRADAHEGLGNIALREGRPEQAVELFERALVESGQEISERPMLAESLGRAYGTLGEPAPAIAIFRACTDRYKREGDTVGFIRFACLLGYALTDGSEFREAERIVAEALAAGEGLADPYTRARLYWSQSRLLVQQGKSEGSTRYAQLALETLRTTEDTYALAHAHELLASIYIDTGRVEDAVELLDRGWPLIAATGTPIEQAHFLIEQARAYAAQGESERAAALAMEITGRLGNAEPVDAGRAYSLLGDVFAALNDGARACEVYELAIEILERAGTNRYLVEVYTKLADLLETEGNRDGAYELMKKAVAAQQAVSSRPAR